jgi:hypothetical protein
VMVKRKDMKIGDEFDFNGHVARVINANGEVRVNADRTVTEGAYEPETGYAYWVLGQLWPYKEYKLLARTRVIKSGRTAGRLVRSLVKD